jgi:hypothetical protein
MFIILRTKAGEIDSIGGFWLEETFSDIDGFCFPELFISKGIELHKLDNMLS